MRFVSILVVLLFASRGTADLVLDITSSVGSGDQTAYAVLDFSATESPAYAFAYSWTGEASVHDMLLALQTTGLGYEWTAWGTAIFADNFSYGDASGDASFYWAHSIGTVTDGGPDWYSASAGVESTPLFSGMISGWYNGFNDDFSTIPPELPLIPAPASLFMLMPLLMARRRRER